MKNFVRFNVSKYVLSCLSVMCVLFFSSTAQAQIEGCDPKILELQQAKSQAKVAYDIAATEQILVKPDSVLALTCFNRSAGVSAERGGDLFSGSFIGNGSFVSLITDMLQAFFAQFIDAEAFENPATAVLYNGAATSLEDNEECTGVEDMWTRIKEKGVSGGVPMVTFQDLIDGIIPSGAGTRFIANFNTAIGDDIFGRLNTALTDPDLPRPNIPAFGAGARLCDILNDPDIGYSVPCVP